MTGHSTSSKSSKAESKPAGRGEAEERACCEPDERGSQTSAGDRVISVTPDGVFVFGPGANGGTSPPERRR